MAEKDAGVYGSGVLYTDPTVIDLLRASGMTTVVAWAVHVNEAGDLIFNDKAIVHDGEYVGEAEWPVLMKKLKAQPSTVKRLLFSIGGWETGDFNRIRKLIAAGGLEPEGILHRNFTALKKVMPWIDGIDFDDEELYEEETTVPFARMLYEVGFTVTFCPYSNEAFWIECLAQLNEKQPGLVSGFNLQCYAGGAGNEPGPWIEAIEAKMGPGFDAKSFVRPGLWGRHGQNCEEGECPEAIHANVALWSGNAGIVGAWVWQLDELLACEASGTCSGPMTIAAYAEAILDGLAVTPGGPAS
jgi:hypothetical protein